MTTTNCKKETQSCCDCADMCKTLQEVFGEMTCCSDEDSSCEPGGSFKMDSLIKEMMKKDFKAKPDTCTG